MLPRAAVSCMRHASNEAHSRAHRSTLFSSYPSTSSSNNSFSHFAWSTRLLPISPFLFRGNLVRHGRPPRAPSSDVRELRGWSGCRELLQAARGGMSLGGGAATTEHHRCWEGRPKRTDATGAGCFHGATPWLLRRCCAVAIVLRQWRRAASQCCDDHRSSRRRRLAASW